MKLHKTIIFTIFLLLIVLIAGCSSSTTQEPNSFTPVQATLTPLEEQPTSMSKSRLQITYVQKTSDNSDELYAIEVTCQTDNKLCLDNPKLLFKTLPSSASDFDQPRGSISSYSWAPDGGKIVLSANKDIFIGDVDSQEWQNITNSAQTDEYEPKWSADGEFIYYLACTQDSGSGSCKLIRSASTGDNPVVLLNSVDKSINDFAVSTDEQVVVFSAADGFEHLYQSNVDGSNVNPITPPDSEETSPFFSSDAKKFVFVRTNRPTLAADSNLISDVIMRDFESGEENNLTEEFDDEVISPAFSFDGEWVAFDAFDTNLNANIYVVSIDHLVIIPVTQGSIDKVNPSWRQFHKQQ